MPAVRVVRAKSVRSFELSNEHALESKDSQPTAMQQLRYVE